MLTSTVINFFGSNAAATKALGMRSSGTICNWGEVVPRGLAFELQHISKGVLQVDLSCYKPEPRDNPEFLAELEKAFEQKRKNKAG